MSHSRPFFHIIGAGRSGTSLLSCLIDAHSRCCVDPERYSSLLAEKKSTSAETASDVRASAARRIDNYLDACRARAAEVPDKIWGHKVTIEQISGLRDFRDDSAHSSFIQAEVFIERAAPLPTVFIVRDGRSCIASKLARTDQSLEQAIARWKFAVDFQQRMERVCPSIVIVKYEDLVRDSAGELTRIGQLLGFDYEPGMLAGVNSDKLQAEYRREGFDIIELGDDPPWVAQIAPELASLGYLAPVRA